MGHRGSGSGSSSSSWSGGRGGRPRRHSRPQRAPRRRPIAKGKEMSRRRSAAARRAVCMRVRRVEVVSDASDVGAESDSDDQWTELDDASGSSDSSSLKEAAAVDVDCNGFQHKAEAPAMGQFLLPLLSSDAPAPDPEHFLIRHEDILQLLASAEEIVHDDIPLEDDSPQEPQTDMLSGSEMLDDDAAVTAEEEAALLHYVCGMEAERLSSSGVTFSPVQDWLLGVFHSFCEISALMFTDWLLGVFHSFCEISALMFTVIGTNMSVEMVTEDWVYRARFGCHCRLCLCLANNADALLAFIRDCVWALAHCGSTVGAAARMVRAVRARADAQPDLWDIPLLRRALAPPQSECIFCITL
ncbi:hypothetical protein B5X24_HaOG215640 [Helicoverpa armigera]|uniref:Uncharacterized protein n=1 Tax=Helicoverpa armigera TaxID=29058 RepID=A0A2W1B2U8_HELAM|nr:hypothetical protein B5X24_HaOG215640 [Helicoverpa armigera]